jgi:mannose-6-phosphate isomerase-like protein (cupin superfamily)
MGRVAVWLLQVSSKKKNVVAQMAAFIQFCFHCKRDEAINECTRCGTRFCSEACQNEAWRMKQPCCRRATVTLTSNSPAHVDTHVLPMTERPGRGETFGLTDGDLERITVANTDYRRVVSTTREAQLVLMALRPGEHIGLETHRDGTQFVRVEAGEGERQLHDAVAPVRDGSFFMVAPGVPHDLRNTSRNQLLHVYAIYAPPQHAPGLVQTMRPPSG